MKVIAIFMKAGGSYRVGVTPPDLEDAAGDQFDASVAAIDYHRDGAHYNKGFQTGKPGYSVKVNSSDIRRLVPENQVVQVWVDIESDKKKEKEVIPDLPASDQKAENVE